MTVTRYTSDDLALFPDPIDGTRYEIIDGELHVSKQPHLEHQFTSSALTWALHGWSRQSGLGIAPTAPGLILAEEQDVVPDIVWISNERLPQIYGPDGKLHGAPELVVEILSPGGANERRDRNLKLGLYSRIGVEEYWIADWRLRTVEVYRRDGVELHLTATLRGGDVLTSPLLPDFALSLGELWGPFGGA